jgi:hypothetical protein
MTDEPKKIAGMDLRTDAEHLTDFLEYANTKGASAHMMAVAREIMQLKAAAHGRIEAVQVLPLEPGKLYIVAIRSSAPSHERDVQMLRNALKERGVEALVLVTDGGVEALEAADSKRVQELLEANNRYLEEARDARRQLEGAKVLAVLTRNHLRAMRDALEVYAAATDGTGALAKQTLEAAFGASLDFAFPADKT